MPQMMPINWMILMIYFLSIFLMINILNYFIYLPQMNKSQYKKMYKNSINWKW